jgi:type I restriction enzyme S subunit
LLEATSKKDSSNLNREAYKLVQPRDLAYNKMRAWQGAIGASALRGIISPAYVVMRLRKDGDLPSYFHHLYRTPQFAKEAERWSYGITSDMWSLRPEHFKMIYSPEPPPSEQAAIVRFLDWANGRLEQAIQVKRKMIALLNEQKQAIIHRAVTHGLDSSIPLKPSGIPWLGDISQHWDVRKLKFEMSFRGGGTPSKSNLAYWNGSIPWVSPKDMKSENIDDAEDHITERAVAESSTNLVPAGSLLMVVRSGILQRTIPVARCIREVALNQDMKA